MIFHKKFKNKKLIYLIFFLYIAIYISGAFSFKSQKIPLEITQYLPMTTIFIDRDYINNKNDDFLKDKILIKQNRHNNQLIKLKINKKVIIYRVLCKNNDNKFYSQWHKISTKIQIKGISCNHTNIVKKFFLPGVIILLAGGPIASDPIFLDKIENNTNISLF